MNTKEAIEKVENKYEGWMGYARSQKEFNQLGKECDQVTNLLKQGEAYRKMWEESKHELYYRTVDKLEQKYLKEGE